MSGLNRSYDHLKRMGLRVLDLPIEDLANYADKVLVANVHEPWVNEQVLQTELEADDLVKTNATSFGNLAYVAMYSKHADVRKKAIELIEAAKRFRTLIS